MRSIEVEKLERLFHLRQPLQITRFVKPIRPVLFLFCLWALSALNAAYADTYVSGNITEDTTWTVAGSPYIVTGIVVVEHPSANNATVSLTIEPGVEVRFESGAGLTIGSYNSYYGRYYYGALIAQGTVQDPIRFTSNSTTPSSGDWAGIYFSDAAMNPASELDHCIVEYGGQASGYNIRINTSSPVIQNSTIRHSGGSGIYLTGNTAAVIGGDGLGNTISDNGTFGIQSEADNPYPVIAHNTFNNNGTYAVSIRPTLNDVSSNTGTGNGADAIRILGGLSIRQNTIWQKNDLPYVVSGAVSVEYTSANSETAMLTIEPGVEVRFESGAGLTIGSYNSYYGRYYYGALIAQGTVLDPIRFTSNSATPSSGDWAGISFSDAAMNPASELVHCIVEYGGQTSGYNIRINTSSPVIQNSTIRHSSGSGIYLSGNTAAIIGGDGLGNTISDNGTFGIQSEADNPYPVITHNTFNNNGTYAVSIRPTLNDVSSNTGTGNGADAIRILGGLSIRQNTMWQKNDLPYVVSGAVSVRYTSANSETATLTIEPGVEVRFEPGASLTIGSHNSYYGHYYYGALLAVGTTQTPIKFTSTSLSTAWEGIVFSPAAANPVSELNYCIVEYGGETSDYNISIDTSSPKIQNSIIRHSIGSGIYMTGNTKAIIGGEGSGNTISNNGYLGILCNTDSPYPIITHNAFNDNGDYAISIRPTLNDVSGNTGSGNGTNAIRIVGGLNIGQDTIWRKNDLPYLISATIGVRYVSANTATATLTIAPGVEVRFEYGAGLTIGRYHSYYGRYYYGALIAQGTIQDPIKFTSHSEAPTAGDWQEISFTNATADEKTVLEHCIIEYGGQSNHGNLYLDNASPTIQYNTIRNSSHSGIYVSGTGSNAAELNCNDITGNLYGIYTTGNGQPYISGNNFTGNQNAGVHNASTVMVTADGNWWGDINGPGYNGDEISGNVTVGTWLTEVSTCRNNPPTNMAPHTPSAPQPADAAVRVALSAGTLWVSWTGGDPNLWDTVTYDVYLGTVTDNLVKVGDALTTASHEFTGLQDGVIYYWQVIAHDAGGLETAGPVWYFVTLGGRPDLTVSAITWTPEADLQAGQEITLTAAIENSGAGIGPVVDPFTVDFRIDGVSVGTRTVNPVIAVGGTVDAVIAWTAAYGDHTVEVVADSGDGVEESNEGNNSATAVLPRVADPTPPQLISTNPADGAVVSVADPITFTLADEHSGVDDAAVIAGVQVQDGNAQAVGGGTSESDDTFTFTPDAALAADTYTVSLIAADMEGNTQNYSFTFTLDNLAPIPPAITGGTVFSGLLQVRPAANQSNTTAVTVTGTREDDTRVLFDSAVKVDFGNGDWSTDVTLPQGESTIEIRLEDRAGNQSDPVYIDILVDTIAPVATGVTPADNSFLQVAPAAIAVDVDETGSGVDPAQGIHNLRDGNLSSVSGVWSTADSRLIFTPDSPLAESFYTLDIQIVDFLGNAGSVHQYHFTIDATAPAAPVVNPVTSPTHSVTQLITGFKEAYSAIERDGQQVVDHTVETTWQHTVNLQDGPNTFTFTARDRAGNVSAGTPVNITFDDIRPPRVDTLTGDGSGTGTAVVLSWIGYDETIHGDIAAYRIYQHSTDFSDVTAMTPVATVPAGTFTATIQGLERDSAYWFAVTAEDVGGNFDPVVSAVSVTTTDIVAPAEITAPTVNCLADSLVFGWSAPADTDLAGFKVYFNGADTPEDLTAAQTSYTKTGLAAATRYTLKVCTVDNDGNISQGIVIEGITLLDNPTGLTVEAFSGYINLSWNAVEPSNLLKHYAVYLSDSAFATVEGLTPRLTVTGTSIGVAGLTDGTTYHVAVTSVNNTDGERKTVASQPATPTADDQGPEITNIRANDTAFASGDTLSEPATFKVDADDAAGVSRIVFSIDGQLLRTDYNPEYTCYVNVYDYSDGAHTLTITAYDTLGNSADLEVVIQVSMALPQAPVITSPAHNSAVNKADQVVSGTAEKFTEVMLYHDGQAVGDWTPVGPVGTFSLPVTLADGENRFTAQARNRTGTGPAGSEVRVTLDTRIPDPPSHPAAESKSGGQIRVYWQPPMQADINGYNLYRSNMSFSDTGQAEQVNTTDLIFSASYTDLPPAEGQWIYRVTAVDTAGNISALSPEVTGTSDATAPTLADIDYTPLGTVNGDTFGPGTVNIIVTVSEPLGTTPFLSITPEGGTPISAQLYPDGDTTYTGHFVINPNTPSGIAYAVFSARDKAGNRGTGSDQFNIDARGPAVRRLEIFPASPVKNEAAQPAVVTLSMGLNEAVKAGSQPQVGFTLSGHGQTTFDVDTVLPDAPQSGDAETWRITLTLPADAGADGPETLQFVYQAADAMDNISTAVDCANQFQVYQGDLPPLAAPFGLNGTAGPQGRVNLSWQAVEQAAAYQLYRQAPGETELTAYAVVEGDVAFEDQTTQDSAHIYAVASIRRENNQESASAMSAPVTVTPDSTIPNPPRNLHLDLVPQGIRVRWEAPIFTETVTYNLYRANATEITTTDGLTPLVTGISVLDLVDPTPSVTDHCYAVTAVDAAGNESLPSNSVYRNFGLLPVDSITVTQTDSSPPEIAWTHPDPGTLAGYDIYLGPREDNLKFNAALLSSGAYVDYGFSGNERTYSIVAVDANQVESLPRSVTLPLLNVRLAAESRLERGIMNRLVYEITNTGGKEARNVRVKLKLTRPGREYLSEKAHVPAGQTVGVAMIVGGNDDLEAVEAVELTIESAPNAGESLRIVRHGSIDVYDGMMLLQIFNEEFLRGGAGRVWFSLTNTGGAEVEIVTADNSGNAPSPQIRYYIEDADENVIAVGSLHQALGDGVITLPNKKTVARIAAGAVFTSQPMDLVVPFNAPDDLTVRLEIDQVHHHLGQSDQVTMTGMQTRHQVVLVDTSYYGEITQILPAVSDGSDPVTITGRAVERGTGEPLSGALLNLFVTHDGFERKYEVYTDNTGSFTHLFEPLPEEGGIYTVRALHPDLLDRPEHGRFVINQVNLAPSEINLSIPRNYEQKINIKVNASQGAQLTNLQLELLAEDQPDGHLPAGVHFIPGDAVDMTGGTTTAQLAFDIWADNTADELGRLVLRVVSDETAAGDPWGHVVLNTHFSESRPAFYFTPDHIETGLAREESITETITFENKGLAPMEAVALTLLDENRGPAPGWVILNSPADLGDLAVGDTRDVSITFAPGAAVTEGIHTFYLSVSCANYPTTDIGLYVSVSQSGQGSVLFKVSDIYTGTFNAKNELIQGLANARITVQNEQVLTIEETRTTDPFGEALFEDLPAGRYKCRVTADSHQQYIGSFWIRPGITVNQDIFLDYNLVTVEWSVNEITIEDRYEIILTATFETDVPAAVVVMEPASVTLPEMQAGDVYYGEFKLTNHGLIRADGLNFLLPEDGVNFKYKFLKEIPDSIEAKESITIPYRVTCLKPLDAGEDGTGGGCSTYFKCVEAGYYYVCPRGDQRGSSVKSCFTRTIGQDCGGSSAVKPSPTHQSSSVSYHTDTGSSSSFVPTVDPIKADKNCIPPPPTTCSGSCCAPCSSGQCDEPPGGSDQCENTGSSVSPVRRSYQRTDTDLEVKVPGGRVKVRRLYANGQWEWENHTRLIFGLPSIFCNKVEYRCTWGSDQTQTCQYWYVCESRGESWITMNGIPHKLAGPGVYINPARPGMRIEKQPTGEWRWSDNYGNWRIFTPIGRLSSYGNRSGTLATLILEEGTRRVLGIKDRNDRQIIWYEYNAENRLQAVEDMEGRRVEYDHTGPNLTEVRDVRQNPTRYEYAPFEGLAKIIDPENREKIIIYDDDGYVTGYQSIKGSRSFSYDYNKGTKQFYSKTATSTGKIKEIWYDESGTTRRVDVNGRTVKRIERDGRAYIVTDEFGNVTRKEYNEWGQLTREKFPDGTEINMEYDLDLRRMTRKIDENGVETTYEYNDAGELIRKVEAAATAGERVTEYTYDADGNLAEIRRPGDGGTIEAVTIMTYDADGNLATVLDPEGNLAQFTEYDIMGNVLKKIDARGKLWQYEYDDAGNLTKIIDPLNNETTMTYDKAGNRVRQVDAELKETQYEYDNDDNVVQISDHLGGIVLSEYDLDKKLTRRVDAEGKAADYEYDAEGRLIQTIDGNGNAIIMEYADGASGCATCSGTSQQPSRIIYPTFEKELKYDKRGRKTRETDVLNDTESLATVYYYDNAGNLVQKTDKAENSTQYTYDALSRLVRVTDPYGKTTEYAYDNRDNLITLTDGEGQVTYFEYDRNNRLTKEIRPMLQETRYSYDAAGNLSEKIDAENQKTEYGYDDAGRLTEIRYYTAADHGTPAKTVSFGYDNVGNLISYNDGTTSGVYVYDDLHRKVSETVNYGTFTLTYSYTYYKNGLKKSFTGNNGIIYDYTYDDNNQLTGIHIPGRGDVTHGSYTWTRPDNLVLPGGAVREYQYDPLQRIKTIADKDPAGNTVMHYAYTHDAMDNITQKVTEHGIYGYDYDDLYRLIDVTNPAAVGANEAYTYDAVGNRLTSAAVTGDWQYNDNNELQSHGDVTYNYDENGSMTERSVGGVVTRFFYNLENRLERVEDGGGSVIATYYYDPFGRRLWKDVGGIRTHFHYSDEGLVGEYDNGGNEIKTYGYRPGSTWTTDPVFMKIGVDYYFYHNDHLGTPQKMTGVNGGVVWGAKYTAFGEAVVDSDSIVINPLRFSGQYEDAETGLHYNYFRYYDPHIGRYLEADPIGFAYGDINQFIYVQNNAIRLIDPYGLRDTWGPTDIPCPLVTPFQAHAFKVEMKMCFKRQYKKDMQSCLFNHLKDRVNCKNNSSTNACDNYTGLSCNEKAKLRYIKCTLKAYQWEILYYEYSWGEALIDMYRFTEREACQHYRRKVDNYEIY